jgi:ABC-type nickel/cobalt efflux system permease component RcnA
MRTMHYLLVLGLALTVTGIVALAHYLLRTSGRLPDFLRNDTLSPRGELIVAIVLVVVGLPLLLIAFNNT